jgi:hypothetical protein
MLKRFILLVCLCLTACGWGGVTYAENVAYNDGKVSANEEHVNLLPYMQVYEFSIATQQFSPVCKIYFLEKYQLYRQDPWTFVDSGRCAGYR